jgi:hypothetical protein
VATKPWTDAELDELRTHADDDCWLLKLGPRLAGRSYQALAIKMSHVRRDLGVKKRRGQRNEDDWQARAVLSSQMLAAATLRVGKWS